jgi:hypothetical protein
MALPRSGRAFCLVIPNQTGPDLSWFGDEAMSEVRDGASVFAL